VKKPEKIRGSDRGPAVDGDRDRTSPDLGGEGSRGHLGRTDEEDASDARRRYRNHGIEPIAPDVRIGPLLTPGEDVLAHHRNVGFERTQRSNEIEPFVRMRGDLYVTSARLVHVGLRVLTIELDDIDDAALVGERVLLVTRGGVGIALDSDRPRLLRVQMAAARAARTRPDP
jgi:hypothetical protein